MPINKYISLSVLIPTMVVLPFCSTQVKAYSTPSRSSSIQGEEQKKTFQDFLTTVAERGHITIIVESFPSKATDKKANISDIEISISNLAPDSINNTIDLIASNYDYTVSRSETCYVLRKKYTNADDVPAVTLAECKQSLVDMDKVISRFSPNISVQPINGLNGQDFLYLDLMHSLTPNQHRKLSATYSGAGVTSPMDSNRVLRLADMNPAQKQLVWRIAAFHYVQRPQQSIQSTAEEIDNIIKNGAVFRQKNVANSSIFGYESKYLIQGKVSKLTYFWPISSIPYKGQSAWINGRRIPAILVYKRLPNNQKIDLPQSLPTPLGLISAEPTMPSYSTEAKDSLMHATLGSVVGILNRKSNGLHYTVDEALADKPVSVYGRENATPEATFKALAVLYGLKVFQLPQQPLRLARVSLPHDVTLSQLSTAILSLYPAPLRRAFGIEVVDPERAKQEAEEDARQEARLNSPDALLVPQSEEDRILRAKLLDKKIFFMQQVGKVSAAMGAYLESSLVPRVESEATSVVRIVDLKSNEQSAFATYLMAITCTDYALRSGRTVPDYILHFDQACLSGGIDTRSDNRHYFSVFLSTLDTATGKANFSGVKGSTPVSPQEMKELHPK